MPANSRWDLIRRLRVNTHYYFINTQRTRTERHRNWTNGCVNSCTNSPEDGPVGPKHVEIQQNTNKILTSVGFHCIRRIYFTYSEKTQQDATVYQNFNIPYFKWNSTCFGRHTAHHQEPKTAQAASGFA